ncbi:hypothetical protein [Jidongwangia harbinensis]|uniref:hypothetical protein n=1 Tax=Jidongwangia harbinensis TaxID=2878561 RepID=UPI001CD95403|nr:hypothetical protein [Jidongwangia harbinensis]MCA2213627.1 hypothetical protein [Jidongwangia harbinensis]
MRHRLAASILAVLTVVSVAACGDDEEPPAVAPPPVTTAPAPAPSGPAPSVSADGGTAPAPPASSDRPEIATNPDGTVNSGGPRPATSESSINAGGLGPYQIGVSQEDLAEDRLIGKVTASTSKNCPGYAGAKGLKRYGTPTLTFYRGRLLRLTVTGDGVATDQGVKIGASMGEVRRKHPGGKALADWTGKNAWFATVGDYGLLLEMQNDRVDAIQAGMAEPMQFKHTDNQGC